MSGFCNFNNDDKTEGLPRTMKEMNFSDKATLQIAPSGSSIYDKIITFNASPTHLGTTIIMVNPHSKTPTETREASKNVISPKIAVNPYFGKEESLQESQNSGAVFLESDNASAENADVPAIGEVPPSTPPGVAESE